MDSIDNNTNGKLDLNDSTEWNRITTFYSVEDMTEIVGAVHQPGYGRR